MTDNALANFLFRWALFTAILGAAMFLFGWIGFLATWFICLVWIIAND